MTEPEFHEIRLAGETFWKLEFSNAIRLYSSTSLPKHAARPLLGVAMAHVLRALVTEEPADFTQAFDSLTAALRVSDSNFMSLRTRKASWIGGWFEETAESPTDLWDFDNSVVRAHCVLWESVLMFRQGRYVAGGLGLRAAWKKFERLHAFLNSSARNTAVIAEESELDMLFGYGAFLFGISIIPRAVQTLISYLGFPLGDRVKGQQSLERCAGTIAPLASLAHLGLLWIESVFYENHSGAEEVFQRILNETPKNSFNLYLGGYLARKQGEISIALDRFKRASDFAVEIPALQCLVIYEEGWCYFLQCDWESARASLTEFLARHKSPSYRAYAGYQLGYSLAMLNRPEEALKVMETVRKDVRPSFSFDVYSGRKAEELLASKTLCQFDRRILEVQNNVEMLEWERASAAISGLEAEGVEQIGVLEYWSGKLARGTGDRDRARECFMKVLELDDVLEKETFVVPHALCELGEMLAEDGESVRAEKLYIRARDKYDNYDMDKPLHRRLILNIDKLGAIRP